MISPSAAQTSASANSAKYNSARNRATTKKARERFAFSPSHFAVPSIFSLFVAAFFILCLASQALFAESVQAKNSMTPDKLGRQQVENETMVLARLMAAYNKADQSTRANMLNGLIAQARIRQALMAELVQTDPDGAARAAIPAKFRAGMPTEIQQMLEQKLELSGELEVTYTDYEDGSYRLRHVLATNNGRFELHLPDNAGHAGAMQSGIQARARGWFFKHDGETDGSLVVNDGPDGLQLLADGAATTSTATSTAILPNTLGEQRVAVMMVNFLDNGAQPWTLDEANDLVFGTVNDFYQENSNGQTWLTGDVYGYYTLPINATCDSWQIHVEAQEAAEAQGVDLSVYNRMIYIFPPNSSCGWTGQGTLGGTVSLAWINGSFTLRTIGHELGHNYGVHHAELLECGSDIIGDTCISITYGDSLDIMGEPGVTGHFNTFNKEMMGWLTQDSGEVITVTSDGNYFLEPYETTPAGGAKGIKIPRGTDSTTGQQLWYYLEYRQALGFDSFLEDKTGITDGVVFRLATEADIESSQLLDMTPDSIRYDLDDAALAAGYSYDDPYAGVTVTTEWTDPAGASVSISFSEQSCTPANPLLSLSPSESEWVEAGTTITYSVTVTNRDSLKCAASDFIIKAELPAGWNADSTSLNLAPGASETVFINVTSAADTTDGFYDIPINATNSINNIYQTNGTVTYVVETPAPLCVGANPLVSLAVSDAQPVEAGTPVLYSVTLTNQDSPECAAQVFNVSASALPAGWTASSASVNLVPGESTTVDINVTSTTNTAEGNYDFTIMGENFSTPEYYGATGATYSVTAPVPVCNPTSPIISFATSASTEVTAGTTVRYDGIVTNMDSSGCAPSDYIVSANLPTGWTGSSAVVTLDPGGSAPITIDITSAPDAADGSYLIDMTLQNVTTGDYSGNSSVNYTIVSPANNTPVATDDSVVLTAKNEITIDVLANDYDPDGDNMTIIQVTQGAKGSVAIIDGGNLLYTPVKNFKGGDSFTYTISDGSETSTATVNISLETAANDKVKNK
ncbi:Ig-like domain-containing protein [Desulforhopalus singaporensis]|uniref:NPCBM-associated, NEW3 domain of alpha-galactosidase n=1 Tax=Desulforhopalus singaporensis TaxID=91360 RepID=A0A1H0L1T6_9BACT|nr:Ig-like domain-containing protein [Desulforhopalus singaporensis]SDO62035.1 NPCBM-associated, NEW3 domain of alpha-galactosidase [Desulforhopalus singaporensis]